MVRVLKAYDVGTNRELKYAKLAGLAEDDKPGGYVTGSEFLEVDTGKRWYYDEDSETWIDPTAEQN